MPKKNTAEPFESSFVINFYCSAACNKYLCKQNLTCKYYENEKNRSIHLDVALICILLIGLWGCTGHGDGYQNDNPLDDTVEIPTISLKDAVYHEGADAWMIPQKDPYTLTNFQKALDNLSAGNSIQPLTRSQKNEFSTTERLEATHLALRIFPKDESEQWRIELIEDIKVAYIPFNHVQLPDEEAEKMETSVTRSERAVYQESGMNIVTYDDFETVDGSIEPKTYIMPILYVVWPCDKPLPDDMEYDIDYEIFIPYAAAETRSVALSTSTMQLLEEEAISLALGISAQTEVITRSGTTITLNGKVEHNDKFLKRKVPQVNLKQRFQLGSNIWETYTRSDGSFSITAPIPTNAIYSIVFQHPKWKITRANSTSPHVSSWLTVSEMWRGDLTYVLSISPTSTVPVYEIHPAVNFYHNGAHSVGSWSYNEGIRVIAMEKNHDSAAAAFAYSKKNQAFIEVYQNYQYVSHSLAGSILHELGHFSHFNLRGGYSGFNAVHRAIRESFASYAGWHMGERYYSGLGFVKPSVGYDHTGQSRQSWLKTATGVHAPYTPMFVDLIDDYNQGEPGRWTPDGYRPNDEIKNVPHSVLRRIAQQATAWASFKNILREYVGIYYTNAELNNYISAYDYWFTTN